MVTCAISVAGEACANMSRKRLKKRNIPGTKRNRNFSCQIDHKSQLFALVDRSYSNIASDKPLIYLRSRSQVFAPSTTTVRDADRGGAGG